MQRWVSLITLGVADLERARTFYEQMGWRVGLDVEETVFFQAGGAVLALWGRDKLSQDSGVPDDGSWGGITLAHNVRSPDEVDRVMEEARAAGARIGREPAPTFYGGYAGVFIDPDGHPWEVAHNPGFALGADGSLTLPSD
jgi:uncharacterized protein